MSVLQMESSSALPSSATVSSGDTIQVRLTSAGTAGTSRSATVTVGETSDTYTVTTTGGGSPPGGGGGGGGQNP